MNYTVDYGVRRKLKAPNGLIIDPNVKAQYKSCVLGVNRDGMMEVVYSADLQKHKVDTVACDDPDFENIKETLKTIILRRRQHVRISSSLEEITGGAKGTWKECLEIWSTFACLLQPT